MSDSPDLNRLRTPSNTVGLGLALAGGGASACSGAGGGSKRSGGGSAGSEEAMAALSRSCRFLKDTSQVDIRSKKPSGGASGGGCCCAMLC